MKRTALAVALSAYDMLTSPFKVVFNTEYNERYS
jgi:hypothetical protein